MRKTKEVLIDSGTACADRDNPQPGENRDFGKKFLITEMPAHRAEKWAMRLTLAMTKAGIDIPPGSTSWGAILAYGVMKGIGLISWAEAEPLLDEMFGCVSIIEELAVRPPTEWDIDEVQTRLRLRSEVFELHSGFSPAAIAFQLAATLRREQANLQTTPTSHPLSEPPSPAERPH